MPDGRREREALGLAIIPIGIAFVVGVLLLPRRAPPEAVPLPIADRAAVERAASADRELAARVTDTPLTGEMRALGSAVRAFHTLEAADAPGPQLQKARRAVDDAAREAVRDGPDALRTLRAVQLEGFLVEIERFEATGEQSPELAALAGAFLRSLAAEGWMQGRVLAPDRDALRTMFKEMWVSFLHLEATPELQPTLDEERVLYAFYLSHAHVPRGMREAIAAARRGARDARACAAIDASEQAAIASWRLERIGKLAALDPAYPAAYARGVACYRKGDFRCSAQALRTWLTEHPDGPLALRAQNYLRAAVDAESAP